jgi:hypothetical protein
MGPKHCLFDLETDLEDVAEILSTYTFRFHHNSPYLVW